MNEPLKGKEGYVQSWEIIDLDKIRECNNTTKIFEAEDIKSAVEWLKGRMLKIDPNCTMDWDLINVLKMIDEAFEDVVNQK